MKNYFKYTPFWVSIPVNIILGFLSSGPFIIGLIFTVGLFSKPTLIERLAGIIIMCAIAAIFILVNYIAFLICRKKTTRSTKEINTAKIVLNILILFIVILGLGLSFFFLPDLWIILNGWWF